MYFRFVTSAIVAISLAAPISAADLPSPHDERLNAWRMAGDFAAAEHYCRQQLARTVLSNVERHALTLELAQLSLEHALQSPGSEAGEFWAAAKSTASDYAATYSGNPRLAQLLVQSALAHVAHGELLLAGAGELDDANEPARVELREAIKLLNKARDRVAADTRNAPRSARREAPVGAIAPWSIEELRSLDRSIRYELARALRRQAEAYPAESDDRALAATQAVELFLTLAALEDVEPLAWPSRVQLVGCERLLRHWKDADLAVQRCQADALPLAMRSMLRAERLRLALAREDVDGALQLAMQPDAEGREYTLDEDLALLDVQLAAARHGGGRTEPDVAAHHSSEASRRVQLIGNRWGAFWGEYAATRLARHLTSGSVAADHQAWTQAGDALYQQGKSDEALSAYDQARAQAISNGGNDAVMLLELKGAAVEQTREHFAQAAERFRVAALRQTQHPRAADAHLAAIHNLARGAAPSAAQTAWLEEHLQHWPNTTTSARVRIWLAAAHAERRDWRAAVELLAKVERGDPLAGESIRSAHTYYTEWLMELSQRPERQAVVDGALRHYAAYGILAADNDAANSTVLLAAAAAAELLIRERRTFPEAERALSNVLERTPNDNDAHRGVAEAWLFAALVAQPAKLSAAQAQYARLPKLSSKTLEAILDAMNTLPAVADAAVERERVALRLKLIERRCALLSEDDEQGRRRWDRERAAALGDLGQHAEAIQVFQRLRQSTPRDVPLNTSLGHLLAQTATHETWTEAVDCWRNVERESAAGSESWFEAKYRLAELHFRFGDRKRAAKLILLTRTLHPELGGPAWRGRFEDLLAKCEAE